MIDFLIQGIISRYIKSSLRIYQPHQPCFPPAAPEVLVDKSGTAKLCDLVACPELERSFLGESGRMTAGKFGVFQITGHLPGENMWRSTSGNWDLFLLGSLKQLHEDSDHAGLSDEKGKRTQMRSANHVNRALLLRLAMFWLKKLGKLIKIYQNYEHQQKYVLYILLVEASRIGNDLAQKDTTMSSWQLQEESSGIISEKKSAARVTSFVYIA